MIISRILPVLRDLYRKSKRVKQDHGVPVFQQLREIMLLRKNNVGIDDYYNYRIYDPKLHPTMADKLSYTGWRAFDGEFRRYSEFHLQAMAYEKHIFSHICKSFDLPIPNLYAVYTPRNDCFERHRSLTDRKALAEYLSSTDNFPFFGKPSNANEGFGGIAVMSRETDGRFKLISGDFLTLDELVEKIDVFSSEVGTYLITEFLVNDDEMRRLAGDSVVSFRIVVLVRNGEPELFRASVLVPVEGSHISNARGFVGGTVSCGIDIETGTIQQVLGTIGLDAVKLEVHPVSKVKLLGYQFDGWPALTKTVLNASKAWSPFHMQHWDIALTSRGPVIMEMNFIGNVAGVQLHGPPGLYNEQYLSFREDHMYKSQDAYIK